MLTVLRLIMIAVAFAVLFVVPVRIETASGSVGVEWFGVFVDLVAVAVMAGLAWTWRRERTAVPAPRA